MNKVSDKFITKKDDIVIIKNSDEKQQNKDK